MAVDFIFAGESRSFPDGAIDMAGDGLVLAGASIGDISRIEAARGAPFVAIELGTECLGEHIGLEPGSEFRNAVGFARFRLGSGAPTQLIELVALPATDPAAIAAAKAAFESAGFKVARCADTPGRIVDRLLRPYFNAVLRRLDEGLASADDMDRTLKLGLGYPEGPNALLDRTGLDHHHDVTAALHCALGDPDFASPRRAFVAKARNGA
jgi:3-hydroxybutyryl-CoA dehydrogenase